MISVGVRLRLRSVCPLPASANCGSGVLQAASPAAAVSSLPPRWWCPRESCLYSNACSALKVKPWLKNPKRWWCRMGAAPRRPKITRMDVIFIVFLTKKWKRTNLYRLMVVSVHGLSLLLHSFAMGSSSESSIHTVFFMMCSWIGWRSPARRIPPARQVKSFGSAFFKPIFRLLSKYCRLFKFRNQLTV